MREIQFNPKFHQYGELALESPCAIQARMRGNCSIGAFSYIEEHSQVTSSDIGRYCSVARNVTIGPTSHPTDWFSTHLFVFGRNGAIAKSEAYRQIRRRTPFADQRLRTVVGNDVWIGANATIRRGVTIGDGAIVGAGAVVVKDVAPYEIVGGIPARHIRFRFPEAIIERFLQLGWWNYDLSAAALEGVDYSDAAGTIALFEELVAQGALLPLEPAVQRHGAAVAGEEVAEDSDPPPGQPASFFRRRLRRALRKLARALE